MEKVEINEILVTPAVAKKFLESNSHNRPVKDETVKKYANDMRAGRWKSKTYEMIKIGRSGNILDGQHRLIAVQKSGISIKMHFAFGVDDDVFDVLNTGANRTAADVFAIERIKNSALIPGIIQHYHAMMQGRKGADAVTKEHKLTNQQLLQKYNDEPLYWQEVARLAQMWYKSFAKILSPSLIGGFYSFFSGISELHAKQFFNQVCTGEDIKLLVLSKLRTRLMADKMSMNKKLIATHKNALIIKSWNSFRKNDTKAKNLSFDPEKEEFPRAI